MEKSIWIEKNEENVCICTLIFREKVKESKRVGMVLYNICWIKISVSL